MGRHRLWTDPGQGLGRQRRGHVLPRRHAQRPRQPAVEMVPVDRIYSEFGRYIKAGATQYMLLNTSDIRAVSMTAKVVMDTAWGGVPKEGGARATYSSWASREFGDKAAGAVAKVWEDYFHAIPQAGIRRRLWRPDLSHRGAANDDDDHDHAALVQYRRPVGEMDAGARPGFQFRSQLRPRHRARTTPRPPWRAS